MTEPAQIPRPPAAASGPRNGSLLVHGGGNIEKDQAFRELFLRLAGGPDAHLVYIPTAASDAELQGKLSNHTNPGWAASQLGFNGEATIRHTRDRREADGESFTRPLREADAVFLTGGRQWRLADAYLGTRAQREIEGLLQRGGVVAGSSAGATIQGSLLVRGNGDPDDYQIMLGDHRQGFGLLDNVAIDQHLLKRDRKFDLLDVLKEYPDVLGIGIDESTCIWVQRNEFTVAGSSCVIVYDGSTPSGEVAMTELRHGSQYDLLARRVVQTNTVG